MQPHERAILWLIIIYLLFVQTPNIQELSEKLEIEDTCHDAFVLYMRSDDFNEKIEDIIATRPNKRDSSKIIWDD